MGQQVTKRFSIDEFRDMAKMGTRPDGVVMHATVEKFHSSPAPDESNFELSNEGVDSCNDRIMAKGWKIDRYLKNPVVLWAHDSTMPPIGRLKNLRVENSRLLGTVKFVDRAISQFAGMIQDMVKSGDLNACSVGFMPLKWKFTEDKNRPGGIDFIEQDLCELSLCPIPANPNSLVTQRSLGANRPDFERAMRVEQARKTIAAGRAMLDPSREARLREVWKLQAELGLDRT